MNIAEQEHVNEITQQVVAASKFADWVYHDVRFDCDSEASERTNERLRAINDQYGREAVFGMAGWWAVKAYWRLAYAYRLKGAITKPEVLPQNVTEIMESSDPLEKKRAFVSAQQFISTMTHNNAVMAEAIFNAAYDTGVEEFLALMYAILILSIRISNYAHKIKTS